MDGCASQLARGCGEQWEAAAAGWGCSDVPSTVRNLRKALDPGQPLSLWTSQVKEALSVARVDPGSRMALGSCLFKVFAYALPHAAASAHDASGGFASAPRGGTLSVFVGVDAITEASKRIPPWLSDEGGMFAVTFEQRARAAGDSTSHSLLVAAVVVNFSSDLVALAREFDSIRAAKAAAARGALFGEPATASATASLGSLRDLEGDHLTSDIRSHISTIRDGVGYAVVLRHLLGRLLEAHRIGEAAGDAFQVALLPYAPEARSATLHNPLTRTLRTFSGRSLVQALLAPALAEVQVSCGCFSCEHP